MKHISILALDNATMSCIDSSYQILNRVNDFLNTRVRPRSIGGNSGPEKGYAV